MEMNLQDKIKKYGLSEAIEDYLTHIGRTMSRLDFWNSTVVLEKLASDGPELFRAYEALKLVPGFRKEYLEKEVA